MAVYFSREVPITIFVEQAADSRQPTAYAFHAISLSFRTISMLLRLLARRQEAVENRRRLLPFLRFARKLLAPGSSQLVVLRFAIVIRLAPLRPDVSLLLKLQQRWVERAVVHNQLRPAGLLDAARNAVPVQRAKHIQCPQHHQRERTLPDICLGIHDSPMG